MFIKLLAPFFAFTTVDTGGGGGGGEAAPAPANTTVDSGPADASSAGAPTAPPAAAPPADVDIFAADYDPASIADDAPYRDVKPVREGVTRARQEYGPIAEALAGLPAEQRAAVLAVSPARVLALTDPTIGAELGYIEAVFPTLVEGDRDIIKAAMIARDPDHIRLIAQTLRGDTAPPAGDDDGTPDVDELGFAMDDPNRPLTQAEWDQRFEQRMNERDQALAQRQHVTEIRTKMTAAGYDPDSTDPVVSAQAATILRQLAANPNGLTVEQAVEASQQAWETYNQRIIDEFVNGARERSTRQLTPDGATPSGEQKLDTMEKMNAAAAERAQQATRRAQQL